jgi:thioesterase domain-containing protein
VKQKHNVPSRKTLSIQSWLRPELTSVKSNVDYSRFKADLDQISRSLRKGWVEELAIDFALEALPGDARPKAKEKQAVWAIFALRAEVLRHLLGLPSFRSFSRSLASSDLLADFCGVLTLAGIKRTSKSTLERASKFFTVAQLKELNQLLAEIVGNDDWSQQLELKQAEDATVCLMDSTCLEANIHFPVDWMLLKDVGLTLLQAIRLIREEGLLCRMPGSAGDLISAMNRLCIEMTHSRRRKDAKKLRKKVLRQMKTLLKRIGEHAQRHRDKLASDYAQTKWSKKQAQNIIERINEKLVLLPKVIKQAHERIIGGRQLKAQDKILSAHEREVDIIVRGKAGKETEFGNALFISESTGGFIFDYKLYGRGAPADASKLMESLERQQQYDIGQPIEEVVGDRAFSTKATGRKLWEMGIIDSNCPKAPAELKRRMQDARFRKSQKRRGSTEARVAILKNNAGGRVCRAKGFENRSAAIGWGVLAHNLWWVARKVREQRKEDALQAA